MERFLQNRWLLVTAVVLAHLQLGATYLRWMWGYDHYHFVPLAIVAVLALLFTRGIWVERSYRKRRWIVWPLVGMSLVVFSMAAWSGSPWLGWLSLVLIAGGGFFALSDRQTGGSLWHLWLPVLLTLRLPLGRDVQLVNWLQGTTSRLSGNILNALDVMHHRAGNVFELPGRQLFVEEACSGVQSLFTLLFLTAVYCALERRGLLRSVLLLLASVFWAGFMNVFRVTAIAVAHSRWNMDLASGWPHELLGYVALVLAFILLLSTDRLLYFLFCPIEDRASLTSKLNRPIHYWNRLAYWGTAALKDEPLSPKLRPHKWRPEVLGAAGIFLLLGLTSFGFALSESGAARTTLVDSFLLDEQSVIPAEQTWAVADFEQIERTASSNQGRFSEVWTFQSQGTAASVDFAYPFSEWHVLGDCYRGIGWDVAKQEAREHADGWKYVVMDLKRPGGESGFVVFSQFTSADQPLQPATESLTDGLVDRLVNEGVVLQAQAVTLRETRISDEEKARIIELHLMSRQQIRSAAIRQLNGKADQ